MYIFIYTELGFEGLFRREHEVFSDSFLLELPKVDCREYKARGINPSLGDRKSFQRLLK